MAEAFKPSTQEAEAEVVKRGERCIVKLVGVISPHKKGKMFDGICRKVWFYRINLTKKLENILQH